MLEMGNWIQVRDLLLDRARAVEKEWIPLTESGGRVLGFDLRAETDVPPFDRSAYDGYAMRAEDTIPAAREGPVTLRVTEILPAGSVGTRPVNRGEAVRLMTGAPIPQGADCVIMYEKTEFDAESVRIFTPMRPGQNVVRKGEDTAAGTLLASEGEVTDGGLAGTMAAQGLSRVQVYRRPVIGLISTGSELTGEGERRKAGAIYDANRALFTAMLEREGCRVRFLGRAADRAELIRERITEGMGECDAILTTGGVSAGDWDVTPEAMTSAGAEILVRGVNMKPGMACAFGTLEGKLILGLSGNPASAMTCFCACALPAIRKMSGRRQTLPEPVRAEMKREFPKKSPTLRFLRGKLDLSEGRVMFDPAPGQGNAVLSGAIGCDSFMLVPAGSGPLPEGTVLEGFRI